MHTQLLALGNPKQHPLLDKALAHYHAKGYQFAGFFSPKATKEAQKSPLWLGNTADFSAISAYLDSHPVSVVYVCSSFVLDENYHDQIHTIASLVQQKHIKICLAPSDSLLQGYVDQPPSSLAALKAHPLPLNGSNFRFAKRLVDVLLTTVLLLCIFSWLAPLVGVCIWATSKGPIFFVQKRNGLHNKVFSCIKFRTMYHNVPNQDTSQATKQDRRITAVGRWLRRSSIDELPQLINVLLGNMSLVGPRPHSVPMDQDFAEQTQDFWMRYSVRPGISGLAQIKNYRGEITKLSDLMGRLRLDKFYVNHASMALDFYIMSRTLVVIFMRHSKTY